MMLSDTTIRKLVAGGLIEPVPHDHQIQPASVDLLLGAVKRRPTGDDWLLLAGEFKLASTLEVVTLPANVVGMVAGKSSLARIGLTVEQAGWIDPGFSGQVTLELFNATEQPIQLEPRMPICQVAFAWLDEPAARPYGSDGLRSHYQHQRGPTAARIDRL